MALLHHITAAILALGLVGVFFGMVLESAYIPLPSEIILPYAGYLVYLGRASLLGAMVAGLAGGMVGAILGWFLARYGGRPLVERYGRFVGVRRHELDRAEAWFRRHGDGAVFFGRLLPGIRTYISLPAGVAEMPLGRFVLFSLLGALPWTVLFTYVGYTLGVHWQSVAQLSHYFLAAVLMGLVVWVVVLRAKRNNGPRVRS
ncbi:MAG: DedA family protein [Thermaerobacter sp.]|nr:DedA family protein [Thermaerobacter sp.]